jgi:hypothetical protein
MYAIWSLSGGKQTWGGLPISVAIDPKATLALARERSVVLSCLGAWNTDLGACFDQ